MADFGSPRILMGRYNLRSFSPDVPACCGAPDDDPCGEPSSAFFIQEVPLRSFSPRTTAWFGVCAVCSFKWRRLIENEKKLRIKEISYEEYIVYEVMAS